MHLLVGFFKGFYRLWMRFAYLLGTINRFVFLTLFYWLIVNIANLGVRLVRADLLDRRMVAAPSYWRPKDTIGNYRSQF